MTTKHGTPLTVEESAVLPRVDSAPRGDVSRRRILVIDDDPLVARAARRALEACYDIVVANSGDDGLAELAAASFDLVLCDLMMPGMGGHDVRRAAIQRDPALRERFVFVTGGTMSRSEEVALDECEVPTVHKPFGVATLREFVAQVLDARGGTAQAG